MYLVYLVNAMTKKRLCRIVSLFVVCSGNVLKELVEPCGAVIETSKFQLGDPTVSVLELWGAEYQESDALLVRAKDEQLLQSICDREKVRLCGQESLVLHYMIFCCCCSCCFFFGACDNMLCFSVYLHRYFWDFERVMW